VTKKLLMIFLLITMLLAGVPARQTLAQQQQQQQQQVRLNVVLTVDINDNAVKAREVAKEIQNLLEQEQDISLTVVGKSFIKKDDPDALNIRLMGMAGTKDPSFSYLQYTVVYHRKGFSYPVYIGSALDELAPDDNAGVDAAMLLGYTDQMYGAFENEVLR